MSVGRRLCIDLIDSAENMRRYAASVEEFDTPQTTTLAALLLERATKIEALVPMILSFEGENPRLLTTGGAS